MTREPIILVVDDDATVRRVLKVGLARAGFDVLVAENGVDALAILAHPPGPVALILTDVVMPEMDGVTLVERVRTMPTPPRVIFMSGYVHNPQTLDRALGRSAPFVQKPFDVVELADRIRAQLRLA